LLVNWQIFLHNVGLSCEIYQLPCSIVKLATIYKYAFGSHTQMKEHLLYQHHVLI